MLISGTMVAAGCPGRRLGGGQFLLGGRQVPGRRLDTPLGVGQVLRGLLDGRAVVGFAGVGQELPRRLGRAPVDGRTGGAGLQLALAADGVLEIALERPGLARRAVALDDPGRLLERCRLGPGGRGRLLCRAGRGLNAAFDLAGHFDQVAAGDVAGELEEFARAGEEAREQPGIGLDAGELHQGADAAGVGLGRIGQAGVDQLGDRELAFQALDLQDAAGGADFRTPIRTPKPSTLPASAPLLFSNAAPLPATSCWTALMAVDLPLPWRPRITTNPPSAGTGMSMRWTAPMFSMVTVFIGIALLAASRPGRTWRGGFR